MKQRYAAITIDVDPLDCYEAIHGVEPSGDGAAVCRIGIDRFSSLMFRFGVPATLFLVGRDAPRYADVFRPLVERGCEVASHSFQHDYAFTQHSTSEIAADLRAADAALRPLNNGRAILGFRAPGYNINARALAVVESLGYTYDSSLLPSPAYYLLRAAAIGAHKVMGRSSASIVGDIWQFAGSRHPRAALGHGFRRSIAHATHASLVELPIAVDPILRLPFLGTTWPSLPRAIRKHWLMTALSALDVFVFEFHAIDFLDANDHPSVARIARFQPDLRVPIAKKLEDFAELLSVLTNQRNVRTLAEIAKSRR